MTLGFEPTPLFFFGNDNLTGDFFSIPKPPDLFIGQGQVLQWVQSILEGHVDEDNRAFVSELALITMDNYFAPVTSLRIIYTIMKLGYNEQSIFPILSGTVNFNKEKLLFPVILQNYEFYRIDTRD